MSLYSYNSRIITAGATYKWLKIVLFRRRSYEPHLNKGGEGGVGSRHQGLARLALHLPLAGPGDGRRVGNVLGVGAEVVDGDGGEVGVPGNEDWGVVRHLSVAQPETNNKSVTTVINL